MNDLVGASLGPYTIIERIGRGGMADVYKAVHNSLAVHRALKVILPELVISSDFRVRFQQEAQSVASLRHQNIVQVHDFGTQDSVYFMVMEFIEGRDLKRTLAERGRIRPIGNAIDLVLKIADALGYAHARGLVHRDIKPENVMITTSGEPILMDFGIAKLITADTSLTRTGASIGTPAYMAPEQALGTADICPATDIYALSIVLYELLTGTVPFKADTPVGVMMKTLSEPLPRPQLTCPDIGDELQEVLVKGTAKSLTDRYSSIADFRSALVDAVKRDAAAADDAGRKTTMVTATRERQPPPRESHSTLKAAAVAALTVCITASAGYVWMKHEKAEQQQAAAAPAVAAPITDDRSLAKTPPPPAQLSAGPAVELSPGSATPTGGAPATAIPVTARNDNSKVVVEPPAGKPVASKPAPAAMLKPALQVSEAAVAVNAQTEPEQRSESVLPAPQIVVAQTSQQTSQPALSSQSTPEAQGASSGPLTEVRKGKTTQSDLLRLFGGPNLTTYDEAGLETWIYERASTQVDTVTTDQSRQGSASLGLFFKSVDAGVSAAKSSASGTMSTRSAVRSTTVIVKFSADRTVHDYSVKESYF